MSQNPKEIVSVVDEAFDAFGKIDFAISNAGYIMVGAAEEAGLPRIERLLDTNLLGSIVFAKAVIPPMRKQGGGRILQISSEQSQMAYPGMSVNATTKWGIEGFFEGVIPEIAKFGNEVTLLEPGTASTNITSSSAPRRLVLGSDAYRHMKLRSSNVLQFHFRKRSSPSRRI
jgi:NAD(P)-dependent dehydrogenase (short-subunit alcohol dehydrogenase family)